MRVLSCKVTNEIATIFEKLCQNQGESKASLLHLLVMNYLANWDKMDLLANSATPDDLPFLDT